MAHVIFFNYAEVVIMNENRKNKNREVTEEEKIEILLSILGNQEDDNKKDGIYLDDDGAVYTL